MDFNIPEIARRILSNWGFAEYDDQLDVQVINQLDLSLLIQMPEHFTTADRPEAFDYIQQIHTEYIAMKSLTQAQRAYLEQSLKLIYNDGLQAKLQAFW